MDDWQEAALSNRHVHNRRGQNLRGKAGKRAAFNVHRTFGTYELKCPAAEKLIKGCGDSGRLEVYCLNDNQNALFAELTFPGLLNAVVVLAGSRRVMNSVLRSLTDEDNEAQSAEQARSSKSNDEEESESDRDDDDEEGDSEMKRAREFEKNSFRSPKFWLKWQGEALNSPAGENASSKHETDSGYLVFSGNSCDKFGGTISCESFGWDNVKVKGWKESTRSARDFHLVWHATQT